jgi:hypothetical protein
MAASGSLRPEAVEQALNRLAESSTFRRSELLKKLVRYLCEAELQGRRRDLEEYLIARNALGRPADFSPGTDSSVRTRVHALRQKLSEYYSSEGAAEEIQIELPKGSYIPSFVLRDEPPRPEPPPATPGNPAARTAPGWLWMLAGFGAAAVFAAIIWTSGYIELSGKARTPAVLLDFWAPMLHGTRPVAICVAQPVHLWVRDFHGAPPPLQNPSFPDAPPSSEAFRDWYIRRAGTAPPPGLVLHPSPNSPLWGDSAGAASAARFFARLGVESEVLPEGSLRNEFPIRNRHALIFGRPEFSNLVRDSIPPGGFTVAYQVKERRNAIAHQADPSRRFFNSWEEDRENFGLITILRDSAERMSIVFCGITSDGALAGMEYLATANEVAALKERFRKEGYSTWPPRFQVVVKTTSSIGYPMRTTYASHFVYR